MWEYIILGNLPGTNIYLSFGYFLAFFLFVSGSSTIYFSLHRKNHLRKSLRVAELATANLVIRPDCQPVQMKLFK